MLVLRVRSWVYPDQVFPTQSTVPQIKKAPLPVPVPVKASKILLTNTWKYACAVSWSIFAALMITVAVDSNPWSKVPLNCALNEDLNGSIWSYASLGGSVLTFGSVIARLTLSKPQDRDAFVWVAFNVVFMSVLSLLLSVTWNYGGTCTDNWNVASQRLVWVGTCATLPLLSYLTILIVEKEFFGVLDYVFMYSGCISLLAEFLNFPKQPMWMAFIWLLISCLTALVSMSAAFYMMWWTNVLGQKKSVSLNVVDRYTRRFQLAFLMASYSVLYGTIYFMGLFGLLNAGTTVDLFNCVTVVINGTFFYFGPKGQVYRKYVPTQVKMLCRCLCLGSSSCTHGFE